MKDVIKNYEQLWAGSEGYEALSKLNDEYFHAAIEAYFEEKFESREYFEKFKDTWFFREYKLVDEEGRPRFVPYDELKSLLETTIWEVWYSLGFEV